MFNVALLEPDIGGNVGNAARTCLAVGAPLHLIKPLGFRLTDKALRRAGMDYWEEADIRVHAGFQAFQAAFAGQFRDGRVFSFTRHAETPYSQVRYQRGDVLLFGSESAGLPSFVRDLTVPVRIPMRPHARSLNLAVSVALAVYEAWRQHGFEAYC